MSTINPDVIRDALPNAPQHCAKAHLHGITMPFGSQACLISGTAYTGGKACGLVPMHRIPNSRFRLCIFVEESPVSKFRVHLRPRPGARNRPLHKELSSWTGAGAQCL